MRALIVGLLALAPAAYPNTLILRDNTVVTGTWLGADKEGIRFLVEENAKTYPRADVIEVNFGSPHAASPSVERPAPAPAPRASGGPESVRLGVVYFQNAQGALGSLEKRTASNLQDALGPGHAATPFNQNTYVIGGRNSPVRLQASQSLVFIVQLEGGTDPRIFKLYVMESHKEGRRTRLTRESARETLPMQAARLGFSSYSLTPRQNLPPGEYAISADNSNDTYCFGVD